MGSSASFVPGATAWRRCLACLAIVLALFVPQRSAGAASSGWEQATITSQGIRLTLSVRDRSYPRNALVRVWARMQNLTRHTMYLYDDGPQAAGKYIPQPVVLAQPGGEPLPISLTHYMPYPGPPPLSIRLPTHAVHDIPEIVILRGSFIRLDLTLSLNGQDIPAQPGPTVSTRLMRLRLTAPDAPAVALQTPPARPSATITPSDSVHGQLLAVWYLPCGSSAMNSTEQNIYWTPISRAITPTCTPLLGWHEIAGWLNHSVAEIDWGQ